MEMTKKFNLRLWKVSWVALFHTTDAFLNFCCAFPSIGGLRLPTFNAGASANVSFQNNCKIFLVFSCFFFLLIVTPI